jgi:exodeoxyribonuclease V alpha subunit
MTATVLDRVWRQEDGNSIRTVATSVRNGEIPSLPAFSGIHDGVSIIDPGNDVSETARQIFEQLGGVEPDNDICVIAPRRRAGFGNAQAINVAVHKAHFSGGTPVIGRIGDTGFCVGDRFVCDVNHWDVDLMNGSLGRIARMATMDESEAVREDRRQRGLSDIGTPLAFVEVDGETRLLDDLHLRDCSWGYALTCHRAQGSDFGRVIVVLDDRVDRSWLYTAITRGRRQVVVIGTSAQFRRVIETMPKVDERRVALDVLLNRVMAGNG